MNTGVGGSADSRTQDLVNLQSSLLQHTQSGILTSVDKGSTSDHEKHAHSLPATWVKAAMLIRCNSLVRGHSAVSYEVIDAILKLICNNLTPIIPLRGTISASGDLMPLSYIAGTLEGSPDIWVRVGKGVTRKAVSAREALVLAKLNPFTLQPKEALGLINGTAPSTAVACIALYESHHLALLAQILTAMAVEALQGQAESFHPFIAQVRPHPGQIEAARNILMFLQGSRLAIGIGASRDRRKAGLYQDRYPLRTSPQWVGPQLEDLLLAQSQIDIELNSTSDNPLIDVARHGIYSGGNFQAASITSAMEKTRSSLQMLGKMLFTQCTELINPAFSNGLPANLCADDPSLSFTMKGVDVNMAAYMSELAFLANPVSFHTQSAEMHNQAINSLAMVTARYTMLAVEVISMMCAAYLYVACQALNLRVLHRQFLQELRVVIPAVTSATLGRYVASQGDIDAFSTDVWTQVSVWWTTSTLDLQARCAQAVDSCTSVRFKSLAPILSILGAGGIQGPMEEWRNEMVAALQYRFVALRVSFSASPSTPQFLGQASHKMYDFIRQELRVPFHRGRIDHPSVLDENDGVEREREGKKKTIGSWISIIYGALRKGELHAPAMCCLNVDQESQERDAGGAFE